MTAAACQGTPCIGKENIANGEDKNTNYLHTSKSMHSFIHYCTSRGLLCNSHINPMRTQLYTQMENHRMANTMFTEHGVPIIFGVSCNMKQYSTPAHNLPAWLCTSLTTDNPGGITFMILSQNPLQCPTD